MPSTFLARAIVLTLSVSRDLKDAKIDHNLASLLMTLEEQLVSWTGPSSDAEQERQDRTERMIREAVSAHAAFSDCKLSIYAKGSYANNTNVKADSDVDIAVEVTEAEYWGEHTVGAHPVGSAYAGRLTPERLRAELGVALNTKFPGHVNTSGSTALLVKSNSARVDADVVPCFSYAYYFQPPTPPRRGTKIFTKSGKAIVNYPAQQLANGRAKNTRTGNCFKKAVRVLKRLENVMVVNGSYRELPSYFMECLVYNCPDSTIMLPTWTLTMRSMLLHLWNSLEGDEPTEKSQRWLEVNECFYLFHKDQTWTRADGRGFAQAAWDYLGLK